MRSGTAQRGGVAVERRIERFVGSLAAAIAMTEAVLLAHLIVLPRMDRVVHERHRKLDVRNVRYRDGLMMAILAARVPARQPGADPGGLAHQQDRRRLRL
jgi:hypothetical protein